MLTSDRHRRGLAALLASLVLAALIVAPSAGAWTLVQVGPHERSLQVIEVRGGCESFSESLVEGAAFVRFTVTENPPPEGVACPAIAMLRQVNVALKQPLAGRHIEGGERSHGEGGPFPAVVPRLVGLSPADARSLLGGLGLHPVVHELSARVSGLARIVSQSPAAGTRSPADRQVGVRVEQ